jgi:hypothetical protein
MKLDERVAEAMSRVKFVFPQASTSMSTSHICNHDWFGSFELLQVTGVVRLQADPALVASALKNEVDEKKRLAEERKREKREREEAKKRQQEAPREGLLDVDEYEELDVDLEPPPKKSKTATTPTTTVQALVSGLGAAAGGVISAAANIVRATLRALQA